MKPNLYYRHACLTKLALTASLLLVALAIYLLSNTVTAGAFYTVDTDHNLSGGNCISGQHSIIAVQRSDAMGHFSTAQNSLASGQHAAGISDKAKSSSGEHISPSQTLSESSKIYETKHRLHG